MARRAMLALLVLMSPGVATGQPCPACLPLDQVGGTPHRGQALGLYEPGSNAAPASQRSLAQWASLAIVPRDADGAPSADGLIGWVAIGMSNTNQEFAAFERMEDTRPGRNPRLVVLDAAVGGQSAEVIQDPLASYWITVAQRVTAAGLSPLQVQVAWLKEAEGAVPDSSFPAAAETLTTHLQHIVQGLTDRFPNLRLCYLSSRTYGGYSAAPNRSEPLSLETGFAVRWLIARQVSGDPQLNADPGAGPIEAPVLLWGPYLWANGAMPRASDGLTWDPADVESDGVHPSASGEAKVAHLLQEFLATEASAAPWRDAGAGEFTQILDAEADTWADLNDPLVNHGADSLLVWANPASRSFLRFDLAPLVGDVIHAKLSVVTPAADAIGGVEVVGVTNSSWNESTLNAANAPQLDGSVLGRIPAASRGTAVSLGVTLALDSTLFITPGGKLSLGLRAAGGPAGPQGVLSRESVAPPRLVVGSRQTAAAHPVGPSGVRLAVRDQPAAGRAELVLDCDEWLARVTLEVFDVHGRREAVLYAGPLAAGHHAFRWAGERNVAGLHFARLSFRSARGQEVCASTKLVRLSR